jgi:hypothetical protein
VEAETCTDTERYNNINNKLSVAIAGILSERFLRVHYATGCTPQG